VLVSVGLHFTPDGVTTPAALVTINMELLTEFRAHNFNRASSRASWVPRDPRPRPPTDQRLSVKECSYDKWNADVLCFRHAADAYFLSRASWS
jgi:hypothetical protein